MPWQEPTGIGGSLLPYIPTSNYAWMNTWPNATFIILFTPGRGNHGDNTLSRPPPTCCNLEHFQGRYLICLWLLPKQRMDFPRYNANLSSRPNAWAYDGSAITWRDEASSAH